MSALRSLVERIGKVTVHIGCPLRHRHRTNLQMRTYNRKGGEKVERMAKKGSGVGERRGRGEEVQRRYIYIYIYIYMSVLGGSKRGCRHTY